MNKALRYVLKELRYQPIEIIPIYGRLCLH
jgi:hypothetical protein